MVSYLKKKADDIPQEMTDADYCYKLTLDRAVSQEMHPCK